MTPYRSYISTILHYSVITLGAFLLMLPAFYNGYPLVISDTCTYLASGFIPVLPNDRPITYGLLLRILSFNGLSLWPVIFFQAYIVSWLITSVIKILTSKKRYKLYALIILSVLSFATGASWVCSQLMADIYTPIAMLIAFLILSGNQKRSTLFILYTLYFIAVATHLSNLHILSLLLILVFIFRKKLFGAERLKQATTALFIMLLLSVFTIFISAGALTKSRHIFLMGSILDKGVLKTYLQDNCGKVDYALCRYKDSLPADVNVFLWDPQTSPLYKEGGWVTVKPEYDKIISDVFTTPKYLGLYFIRSLEFSCHQLLCFTIGEGNTFFAENSNVYDAVKKYVPNELHQYLYSEQNQGEFFGVFNKPNLYLNIVMACSFVLMIILIIEKRKFLPRQLILFLFICLAGIIINDIDCATFSQVNGRYGCRIMWLISFCTLILLFTKRNSISKEIAE